MKRKPVLEVRPLRELVNDITRIDCQACSDKEPYAELVIGFKTKLGGGNSVIYTLCLDCLTTIRDTLNEELKERTPICQQRKMNERNGYANGVKRR